MATSNTCGVLLKTEETKEIKITNFTKTQVGYVEGELYLQDAALQTMVVRVFPCGRKNSATNDYVCVLFRKKWLRTLPLNFHCTVSVVDVYGDRKFSQTCGMEELENKFEIDQFVKRSTLFENDFELLPNDTLTVLCEVSYTMPSSQRSSKIWSVLSRFLAWYPPKRDDFSETRKDEGTCSLVVETMDGGEFLLPTPSSYFNIEQEIDAKCSAVESSKSKSEKSQENHILVSPMSNLTIQLKSPGSFVDNKTMQSESLSSVDTTTTFSLTNDIQTENLKSTFKKNSNTEDKLDVSSILSGINLASRKQDKSGLISNITEVLLNANRLPDNACKKAVTKGSITSCANDPKENMPPALNCEMGYKNKTLHKVIVTDADVLSKITNTKSKFSKNGTKIKRFKPKPETTRAQNTKILDLGSRKTVQGSDICDASHVFTCMLKTPMRENATKRVKLRNIDADTFDNFLYYLEAHEIIANNFEKLCDLYKMADQYQVMNLKFDCAQHLVQSLDVENFLIILKLADMHSDDKLEKRVHKFVLQNEKTLLPLLQNDPQFLRWYDSWKREDISSDIDTSDDEIEVCDNNLDIYR